MTGYDHRREPGTKARLMVWSITVALIAAAGLAQGRSMNAHGSPVRKEFVGQWQTAIAGPTGIRDYARADISGLPDMSQVQSSVLRIAFSFREDGRYDLVWLWHGASAGRCGRGISWDERGTLSIDGEAWTFQPSSAMARILDSCAQALPTVKPVRADNGTLTVTSEVDARGVRHLRLRYPSGNSLMLDKLTD